MKSINPSTSLRVNGERSRTIKFYTLGCKVNQYDTQEIRERFLRHGFQEISNGRKADVYVINTCTVTAAADAKSRYYIHYARRKNPQAKIMVTGCYAELDSDAIAQIPGVTQIVKNKDKDRILTLLNGPANPLTRQPRQTGITNFSGHTRAFLKIQDGCDNFCSYCKVPLARGSCRSKPLNEIVKETERLLKNGFKEIVLTGICLGAYGKDFSPKISLIDVIKALESFDDLARIRLSSIEAGDVSEELIRKMAESKKLCPHLHIPIQSGDDEILKKMDRRYSFNSYLKLIQKIKTLIPEIAITTDVMVGFPRETEENFQNTIKLIQEIMPLKVHIFPYSLRKGTKAATNFKDLLNPLVIQERISRLKNISENCSLIYKKQFLNRNLDVLIEEWAKEDKTYWQGYTGNYIKVKVKAEVKKNLKNKIVPLRLKKISEDISYGVLC
jgi:threonylcarbamoyladenosine tRNA methylthiotransferase MtaB